jgi:hypothetical protein
MRNALTVSLKVIALTIVSFVAFAVAGVVSGVARPATSTAPAGPSSQAAASSPLPVLLLLCVLVAAVFSWAICRTRLRGWRLVLSVYAAHLGLGTVMAQMESALFLPAHLPPGFVGRMMVMGAVNAAIFAPVAVWIWGGLGGARGAEAGPRPALLPGPVRIASLAAVYVAIYLAAGYFIAFRNPDVLAYYGASDPGTFAGQVRSIWEHTPWFFAFQLLRGVMWIGFALPLILAFRGARLERALLIGCLYSMWIVLLLMPNPYMPESVRLSHLFETLPSTFVFGGLVGWWIGPMTR